jgi:hypothetical protein
MVTMSETPTQEKKTFSTSGIVLISLLFVVLFALIAHAYDLEKAAKITDCYNKSGQACQDVLLPNGETLQDYYDRTGRVPSIILR